MSNKLLLWNYEKIVTQILSYEEQKKIQRTRIIKLNVLEIGRPAKV